MRPGTWRTWRDVERGAWRLRDVEKRAADLGQGGGISSWCAILWFLSPQVVEELRLGCRAAGGFGDPWRRSCIKPRRRAGGGVRVPRSIRRYSSSELRAGAVELGAVVSAYRISEASGARRRRGRVRRRTRPGTRIAHSPAGSTGARYGSGGFSICFRISHPAKLVIPIVARATSVVFHQGGVP